MQSNYERTEFILNELLTDKDWRLEMSMDEDNTVFVEFHKDDKVSACYIEPDLFEVEGLVEQLLTQRVDDLVEAGFGND